MSSHFFFHTILSIVSFYFFCELYVDHRVLHSFPTRRSSDLRLFGNAVADERESRVRSARGTGDHSRPGDPVRPRSEEHTSELQSRVDLVCRLLLEKKKKNKNKRVGLGRV